MSPFGSLLQLGPRCHPIIEQQRRLLRYQRILILGYEPKFRLVVWPQIYSWGLAATGVTYINPDPDRAFSGSLGPGNILVPCGSVGQPYLYDPSPILPKPQTPAQILGLYMGPSGNLCHRIQYWLHQHRKFSKDCIQIIDKHKKSFQHI